MNEEKCIYCDNFAIFKELMSAGRSMEDAFHTVLRNFEEEVTDETFEEGYLSAMVYINNQTANDIKDIVHSDECDCDECN